MTYSSNALGYKLMIFIVLSIHKHLYIKWAIDSPIMSYNTKHDAYNVSPIPDVHEYSISPDPNVFMIMASDGLWNVFSP